MKMKRNFAMWTYNGKPFLDEQIGDFIGFVYIITEKSNSKKYIGKKLFWTTKKLKPLKDKKRKRIVKSQSNWRDYYGSSENLKKRIETIGKEGFDREILFLCENKGSMSYLEAKIQFDSNVLLDDGYYNGIINCRINEKHVIKQKDSLQTAKTVIG